MGTGSIIIKNTAQGNGAGLSSILVPAGNTFGPVIVAVGAGNLAMLAGADHPWANFLY